MLSSTDQMLNHTIAPDVFTASPTYDTRFSGAIGEYFLSVQEQAVLSHLRQLTTKPLSVLEIGGGHLQITKKLLALGHSVTVHGSTSEALTKLEASPFSSSVHRMVCAMEELDQRMLRFDVVIALRLLPHVVDEKMLLGQMVRLAKRGIIFDFASTRGLNSLSKVAFAFKKKIEKNTRPYFNHSPAIIKNTLRELDCNEINFVGQFVFPMGLHRAIDKVDLSRLVEGLASPLRDFWGNPIICGARVNG